MVFRAVGGIFRPSRGGDPDGITQILANLPE